MSQLTKEEIRALLRLRPDADTASSFDKLGVDSWDLIELRATLENRFGLVFSDDVWLSMTSPDDVLRCQ